MNVEDIFWVGAAQVSKLICAENINKRTWCYYSHMWWHMENRIKPIVTNQTKLNKTLKSIEIDYNAVKIFPGIDSERVQNGSRLERVLAWGLGGKFE